MMNDIPLVETFNLVETAPQVRSVIASGGSTADTAVDVVVFVERAWGNEFDSIKAILEAEDIPVVRLDAEWTPNQRLEVSWKNKSFAINGAWFHPRVFWSRGLTPQSIQFKDLSDETRIACSEGLTTLIAELAELADYTINPLWPGKICQLRSAEAAGFKVPDTWLGNHLARISQNIRNDSLDMVVFKAIPDKWVEPSPGVLLALFTHITKPEGLNGLVDSYVGMLQEFMPHRRELRVYYFRKLVWTYEIHKQSPEDVWLKSHSITAQPVSLSHEILTKISFLAKSLQLDYFAVDLLETDESMVFLEVNPNGSWLGVEEWAAYSSRYYGPIARFLPRPIARILFPREVTLGVADELINVFQGGALAIADNQ